MPDRLVSLYFPNSVHIDLSFHDKMAQIIKRRYELTMAKIKRLTHEEEAIKELLQKRELDTFSA